MELKQRIEALSYLGDEIRSDSGWLSDPIARAYNENKWFTSENSRKALDAIGNQFLRGNVLQSWSSEYEITDNIIPKKVGLVLAGNIPLVGFHDILSTFVSGHISLIKCSSKDSVLLKTVIEKMITHFPQSKPYFQFTEKLQGFDAVIATGSNNSARYFEQYFGKYPNIIRKNRSAVGILDGNESQEDMLALGEDIFNYFGLGCRNISKLYVPDNYSFNSLLEVLHTGFKEVVNHNKYRNNFDYNNALFLLNKVEFLMSGSLIITESKEIASRISTLHYEAYSDMDELGNHLVDVSSQIQCVVSNLNIPGIKSFSFGEAQKPSITDYADGVDTLTFLKSL